MELTQERKRKAYLDFFFLAAWLTTSVGAGLISLLWFGIDFRGYYAAARVLLAGGNPYDYRLVAETLLQVTGGMGNNPYYYPLWFAWIFIPLAWLPFQTARAVWMALNVVLWNISLWNLDQLLPLPPKGWKRYALFLFVTILFAWATFAREQAGTLLFALLLAALLAVQQNKPLQAGWLLAWLLVKPNVTLGVVLALVVWLLRKKRPQAVAWMAAALLILLAVSTALTPGWWQPFFQSGFARGLTQVTDGSEKIVGTRINSTFLDWSADLGIPREARFLLYGALLLICAALYFRAALRSQSLMELVSLALLLSYAATPYALQYDYPPLVVAFFWALSIPPASRASRWARNALTAFLFAVNLWRSSMPFRYWLIIGLAALAGVALADARKQTSPQLAPNET